MTVFVQQVPLPSRHAIRSLAEDLTGKPVSLADALPIPAKTTNVYSVYVADRLAVAAVAVLDLEGAARLGGAIGTLPRGGVEEAITTRSLPDKMRLRTEKFLTALTPLFGGRSGQPVRLYQIVGPSAPVPADVAALAAAVGQRMDLRLQIGGYGEALLSVIVR
jgi:hypothetical protein